MAYDHHLAQRISELLPSGPEMLQKQMFGGLGFMLHGNMVCGVLGPDFIARVGPEAYADALQEPGVRPFDLTGRAMRGWVLVSSQVLGPGPELADWVERALSFTRSLPPKDQAAPAGLPGAQG